MVKEIRVRQCNKTTKKSPPRPSWARTPFIGPLNFKSCPVEKGHILYYKRESDGVWMPSVFKDCSSSWMHSGMCIYVYPIGSRQVVHTHYQDVRVVSWHLNKLWADTPQGAFRLLKD